MEFAVVNIYMGPVATKVMKGYSDENLAGNDDLKSPEEHRPSLPQYDTFECNGREIALEIDRE